MRHLGTRLLVGLAAIVVAVMAVGYAFIFVGIARAPGGDLGTVELPGPGSVAAERLDDGTPVFVANIEGEVTVLDARAPLRDGTIPRLVAWCDEIDAYVARYPDGEDVGYDADGTAFAPTEQRGLVRYLHRTGDAGTLVIERVGAQGTGRIGPVPACPASATWVVHEPGPGETFDPSVAIDGEPPGWVWLEGRLMIVGGQALLCDGLELTDGCPTSAVARGINPAAVPAEGVAGRFLGIVSDDAIVGLVLVPETSP